MRNLLSHEEYIDYVLVSTFCIVLVPLLSISTGFRCDIGKRWRWLFFYNLY